ncbi:hypothetical protein [Bartonella tribocorum]|uniref:Uncharacterized protein n=1 Tax=Bartonella tribocorum (strain DSM 28219 / CCUG 45778 / CIP 105476 / IBS 506) TaxID=382640 RepID=A9IXL0_BART1|nr:hypothetical protein [Bartonella tribocorum]CAK02195.1 hypothetical protein BT_1962 [Bartonella tribocorum CIP 105476]CDO49471.1 hypothetical protein BM1374166_01825 [Bartonella tribocorum]
MALFPFSIADIDDPECIRVVLYASGRMGHAPLNALLKKTYEDMTKISKRMDALEKKLNMLDLANGKQKQNAKKDDQSNMNTIVSGGITDIKVNAAAAIDIESSVEKSSVVSQFTSMKMPEIYRSAHQNIKVESSRGVSSLFKNKNRKKET